jgi:hypothetical protein
MRVIYLPSFEMANQSKKAAGIYALRLAGFEN